jgi:uncharacterized protein
VTNDEPTDADGQFHRGRNLICGFFCERDYAAGAHWLEKAAAQNYPPAIAELGPMHFHGRYFPANQKHGLELLEQAAGLGHTDALNTLGLLYLHKGYATFDKVKAIDCFRRAAEADDYEGTLNFALWHETEGNFDEAVKWYRQSMSHKNHVAYYHFASLLADGKGVAQDVDEACRLFDFAGDELQYPWGYFGYARLHDDPKYGRQNLEDAAAFYFMAGDRGIPQAQLRYAELAELGYGDPTAKYDAYIWTRVAMEHLPKEEKPRAEATLARLKKKLWFWQLRAAEKKAKSTIAFLKSRGRC